jgi:hypothetical protein
MIMAKKIATALLILLIIGSPFIGSAQWGSSPNLTPIWGTPITMDPIWGASEKKLGGSFIDPIWEPSSGSMNTYREAGSRQRAYINNTDYNTNSRKQQSPIWNRQAAPQTTEMTRQDNENQTTSLRRRLNAALMSRDTLGRLILNDSLILQHGDSTLQGGSASGSMNSDQDDIAPPPDDPVDAPIDGGLGILLAIALVHGYKQFQRKVNGPQSIVNGQ